MYNHRPIEREREKENNNKPSRVPTNATDLVLFAFIPFPFPVSCAFLSFTFYVYNRIMSIRLFDGNLLPHSPCMFLNPHSIYLYPQYHAVGHSVRICLGATLFPRCGCAQNRTFFRLKMKTNAKSKEIMSSIVFVHAVHAFLPFPRCLLWRCCCLQYIHNKTDIG